MPLELPKIPGHGPQMRGAGILSVVHAVPESGDFLLLRQHPLHVLDRVGAGGIDRLENAKYGFVRAAMQRALQSTDGSGDGRMHVTECSRYYAGGERRGIQFVIGVQDQGDVERSLGRGATELRPFNWYRKLAAWDSVRSGSTRGLPLRIRS